ncbi:Na+/H+ antiporter subunit E [Neobacillus notoginsengisoli]|uniref:Na+/H+ antiporter subunit E n=1 Tax=Neobacillus notoginsengisoli TaxID=1578198 RepID=A0A417YRR0_9BACI|nr:Na+/H+ antiporter subunit E [Neobacillus notoginsengisoli]RHW37998.1 Na+/H+ antiporter subunit E [Neobacillus notoginsengisoli]
MPLQVLTNLFIALLWTALQEDWSVLTFISGYFVGMLVLFLMRRFLPENFYLITFLNIIKLAAVFIQELFISGYMVIRHVIRPTLAIAPGTITLETDLETDIEVTLLSLLVTLTPGSVVINVSEDNKTLFVHVLDTSDSNEAILNSKVRFENSIKRVTRKCSN